MKSVTFRDAEGRDHSMIRYEDRKVVYRGSGAGKPLVELACRDWQEAFLWVKLKAAGGLVRVA